MSPVEEWLERDFKKGLQQGRREGLLHGIELGLQLRFGVEGLRLLPEICKIKDVYVLHAILAGLRVVDEPAELRRIYADHIGAATESEDGT